MNTTQSCTEFTPRLMSSLDFLLWTSPGLSRKSTRSTSSFTIQWSTLKVFSVLLSWWLFSYWFRTTASPEMSGSVPKSAIIAGLTLKKDLREDQIWHTTKGEQKQPFETLLVLLSCELKDFLKFWPVYFEYPIDSHKNGSHYANTSRIRTKFEPPTLSVQMRQQRLLVTCSKCSL